ncbi:protease modulator HflK [Shinella sp. AETb1-6]|uniref:protease modulator HflK n=1 Tax=Shinella sp. AETb1-6 TaxID=2692210 RepID=UPI00136902FC|nr:protease modulator HflK [Shinella sp. AETb1-6]MXN52819.1 protease modulator HflK [Shinella sp. AETb1-6]
MNEHASIASGERTGSEDSPWLQAGRLGFRILYAVTVVAALAWTVSNIREIGPDNQAVVFRFGAVQRLQQAGLLFAWPRPFEDVVLVPAPDRVLEQPVQDGAGTGYLLTGDAGVVRLEVSVFYKVADPERYVLQAGHITPALNRLATRNMILLCAGRDLDSILVARPELIGADSDAVQRRERLRGELVEGINRSLAALQENGAGLGIRVERVDIRSALPEPAVAAFNAVLTASQEARQAVASASNDAAKTAQAATQAANQTIQAAQAGADERIARAKADTAAIISLSQMVQSDTGLLSRLYRDRIAGILAKARSVTTVDPAMGRHLILQGGDK